VSMVGEQRMSI